MRLTIRMMALANILSIGSGLGIGTSSAKADGGHGGYYGGGHYGGGHYGGGYYGGYPGGGYYGGGYPGGGYPGGGYSYYGNGGHDTQPHWHTRQGLFGTRSYYGLGRHDFRPHPHIQTPYGITGYSGGFFGTTQSYSPPTPYIYSPW